MILSMVYVNPVLNKAYNILIITTSTDFTFENCYDEHSTRVQNCCESALVLFSPSNCNCILAPSKIDSTDMKYSRKYRGVPYKCPLLRGKHFKGSV